MLIVNADDWGRSPAETDAALTCYQRGRISAVTAMVYMQDSRRASRLALDHGLDVGLHLNLSQRYQTAPATTRTVEAQNRIVSFLGRGKYSVLIYHPGLRREFRDVFQDQLDEFIRLYGKAPSHVDGHQHKHLCANLMIDPVIPPGQRVRRNFSFGAGEKGIVNRLYRHLLDRRLARSYRLTDYFFSLSWSIRTGQLDRVYTLSRKATVELMSHPVQPLEYEYLLGAAHAARLAQVETASFSACPEASVGLRG